VESRPYQHFQASCGPSRAVEPGAVTTLLVGAAGLAGVMARYGLTRLTLHTEALLWTTVGINVVGSFLLGILAAEHWFSRDVREALGVGFLGGFTTFSTFSVQIVLEVDGGRTDKAVAYLVASVAGGIAAATLGFAFGRRLA
jgi:fluoride exporter